MYLNSQPNWSSVRSHNHYIKELTVSWRHRKAFSNLYQVSLNFSDSIKLIELIWKTMLVVWNNSLCYQSYFYYTLYYYYSNSKYVIERNYTLQSSLLTCTVIISLQLTSLSQSNFYFWWLVVWRSHINKYLLFLVSFKLAQLDQLTKFVLDFT